jgi:NhaP-type Na+/H+ or K+/H+ antiporter
VASYAIEAFVFGYLGLTFPAYMEFDWSWTLILVELFVIIVGRFIGTIGVIKLLEY